MFKQWREKALPTVTGIGLGMAIFMMVLGPAGLDAAVNSANNVAGGSHTLTGSGNVTVTPSTLQLVKQVWTTGGSCLASAPADATCNSSATAATVPSGTTLKFLIFVKNASDVALTDIRFSDALDVSGTGFTYVAASIKRTSAVTPPNATDSAAIIFANADGGTAQTDALSNADNAAFVSPNLTVGGDGTAGQNATVSVAATKAFGIVFQVTKN
ncbi:MAG: hypothetical protein WBK96_11795 [Candidatus Manganitrophaceae bacterium]